MNFFRQVVRLTLLALVSPFLSGILNAQSEYENPWGITVPAQTTNLAYERYPVEGFAWPTSVLPGQTIKFYISVMDLLPQSSEGQTYEMKIFRSPNASSAVHSFANAVGRFYPLHDSTGAPIFPGDTTGRKPVDYKVGCMNQWDSTSISFTIPSDWPSGFYYARLIHLSSADPIDYYYIPFVVRSLHPGDSTKILFKLDFNTWHAYNYWGGGSLYSLDQDPVTLTSDSVIAIDRPLRRDISQWCPSFAASIEKVLRDSGYTMEYCNNIDLDSIGPGVGIDLLAKYQMLVLWGHDEYWSLDERTNIEAFKGNFTSGLHGNIARFTANTCYWLIRWIGSESKYLKLQCRKNNYPSGYHPAYDLWRLADSSVTPPRAANPEAKFLGSQYERGWNNIDADPLTEEPADRVYKPSHWIFKNANLTTVGQEFGLGILESGRQRGIVAIEVDNTVDNLVTYNFSFPLDTLAQRKVYSNLGGSQHDSVLHQMIYYEDTVSNARMFAQSAIGWYNGLEGTIDPNDVIRMKTITINIISHFSGKKYLGNVYTGNPLFPLTWQAPIELNGDTRILPGKYLKVIATTVTIDSTFYVDGTLEINGNVTMSGLGSIIVGSTGRIILASGASLTLDAGVTTIFERDSAIQFGSGSSLEVKGLLRTTYGNHTVVPYGSTLRIYPGAVLQWGSYGRLVVEGTLSAIGTNNKQSHHDHQSSR